MCRFKLIEPEETYALRLEVLKTCEAYAYKYKGDFDKNTKHLAIFDEKELVGIVSVMFLDNDLFHASQIQMRGMAVLQSHQKKGIGVKLLNKVEELAKDNMINLIWCNARDYAVDFYKKQGFIVKGEKFYIKNVCDHYVLFKEI